MTDITTIANTYIATWNEIDAARRAELLQANWSEGATYVDPLMAGKGRAEISALIAGVHERFPGFHFQLLGTPDGHGSYGRFSWGLGPIGSEPLIEGSDFVETSGTQLLKVTGFLDKLPAA